MRRIALILAAAVLAAAPGFSRPAAEEIPSWRGPTLVHQRQLVREAEAFMAEYARLLLAGDRRAIAALYDPDGAILVRNGRRIYASHADVVQRYAREGWQPPAGFAWRDLHFEAVGPEAVTILGAFEWSEGDGRPEAGSYHALLRREDGRLFIRIEDEAVALAAR